MMGDERIGGGSTRVGSARGTKWDNRGATGGAVALDNDSE